MTSRRTSFLRALGKKTHMRLLGQDPKSSGKMDKELEELSRQEATADGKAELMPDVSERAQD